MSPRPEWQEHLLAPFTDTGRLGAAVPATDVTATCRWTLGTEAISNSTRKEGGQRQTLH